MATIRGTARRDILRDTGASNTLLGLGGNDDLYGNGGNDTLKGGTGLDRLFGGLGNDKLFGEAGNDQLDGGAGNDTLDGGLGNDKMKGGLGNDTFIVNSAADITTDTGGIDLVISSVTRTLGTGLEKLTLTDTGNINGTGNSGNNVITGNGGANVLIGGAGIDVLSGGSGNDILRPGADGQSDSANGGDNIDWVSYEDSGIGVTAALSSSGASEDVIIGVENLKGSNHVDTLRGDAGDNRIEALGGLDTVFGGDGSDTIVLTVDNVIDVIDGGNQIDWATYENETLPVYAALGGTSVGGNSDILANIDFLRGGLGNDFLLGDGQGNLIEGWGGNDFLTGAGGGDTLVGGSGGSNTASYNATDLGNANVLGVTASLFDPNINLGDAAGDSYSNIQHLEGSGASDLLEGNNASNALTGLGGIDTLRGLDGNDLLIGGFGKDTMTGGAGADTFDFNSAGESPFGVLTADLITDFQDFNQVGANHDTIDLQDMAVGTFVFLGFVFAPIPNLGFTGGGTASVRYAHSFPVVGPTIIQGDANGDGVQDFEIIMTGLHNLQSADFLL